MAGDCRGTESDGTKSDRWCSLCYVDGRFVNPECTIDEMVEIVDSALQEQHYDQVMRDLAKQQIPTLERWRK